MDAKGGRLFIVASILMIVGGTAGIIAGVQAVLSAGALAASLGGEANFGLLMCAAIVAWAGGVAGLIAGISGARRAGGQGKAAFGIALSVLAAALSALGNALTALGGGGFSAAHLAVALALAAFFLFGALRSKWPQGKKN